MKIFKKAKIVVMLAAVVLTLTLWGIRTYAGCLDVRDYGHHMYSARVYILSETTCVQDEIDCGDYIYKIYVVWQDRLLECVCGAQARENHYRADQYHEIIMK